jgi:hypothetical protein
VELFTAEQQDEPCVQRPVAAIFVLVWHSPPGMRVHILIKVGNDTTPSTRKFWVSNGDLERFETYSRHRSDDLEEVGEHMAIRNTCGARIGLSALSKPRQGNRLDSRYQRHHLCIAQITFSVTSILWWRDWFWVRSISTVHLPGTFYVVRYSCDVTDAKLYLYRMTNSAILK